MKHLILFLALSMFSSVQGQTSLSGIVNTYDTLISQNSQNCYDELLTDGSITYNSGDLLLIISTRGATYDTANGNNYGQVMAINQVGLYELAWISAYSGGKITLDRNLQSSYPTGTQILKVPHYQSAEVRTAPLRGKAYDGKTGGIIALKAEKLTLSNHISAEGLGYPGGFSTRNMGYSCGETALFYPAGHNGGAPKGAGAAAIKQDQSNGRGSVTLGGGGGNNHNAGGGGGANAGTGGQGGDEWNGCNPASAVGGQGGKALGNTFNTRIFMGGGGGSGHNNLRNFSSEGGNGGGIILLMVDTLVNPNNFDISAAGAMGKSISNNGAEGAGGGGAGGSILVSTKHIIGTLRLSAKGGNGGLVNSGTAGPGGGAGGGSISVTAASQLNAGASITTNVKGGMAGNLGSATNRYGATAGTDGRVDTTFSMPLLEIPSKELFPEDTSLCADNFRLGASVPGPYLWSTGSTDSSIIINASGTYWLRAGTAGCAFSDTIEVKIFRPVQFSLGTDTSLCPGDSLELQAPSNPSYQLLWDDGSSALTRTVSPGATYWLEVRNDSCLSRDSINIYLEKRPNAHVFPFEDTLICAGDGYLVDLSAFKGSLSWQDGSNSKLRTIQEPGWYWLEYTNACFTLRDSLFLETTLCDSCLLTVPNTFTPNGDGLNDHFQVFFGCELSRFQMEIGNRWGVRVFYSQQEKQFWDGVFLGQPAPSGTYVYKLKYRVYGSSEWQVKRGMLQLLR